MKKVKFDYYFQKASEISEYTKFKRIGIIPYFKKEDETFLFMMLDNTHNQITDCGGLPYPSETWIETAIRETKEESRNTFVFTKEQILEKGDVFWRQDHRIAVVFMDISDSINNETVAGYLCYLYRISFFNGVMNKDNNNTLENSDLFFFNVKELLTLIRNTSRIFKPVKLLLSKFFSYQTKILPEYISKSKRQVLKPPELSETMTLQSHHYESSEHILTIEMI